MTDESNLLQCEITLTRACNLRCTFCYAKNFGYNANDHISYADLKNIIDFCGDAKTIYVFFSGGEPCLYPNLIDILEYINAKSYPMSTAIATNGIILNDYIFCKKLVDCGVKYIDISMKGKSSHEWITTTNYDGYAKQIEAIRNLSKLNVDFTCSMVVTYESVFSICDTVKTAHDNGGKQFSFTFIINNNDDKIKNNEYLIKNNPLKLIEAFILQMPKLNDITEEWWVEYSFPLCIYSNEQLELLRDRLALPCQVHLQNTVCFDTNLNLLPCSMYYNNKIGRLGVDFRSYEEFINFRKSYKYINAIKGLIKLPSTSCKSCEFLNICYGGCPVLWKNYSFDVLQKFINC